MVINKNIVLQGPHNKPILTDVFYNANTSKKPIVIFCHGYKGFKDWGAWDLMAQAFANRDIFFIKFNFSHNGTTINSPTEFEDLEAFGQNNYVKELDDLAHVMNWVTTNPDFKEEADSLNLNIIGHSRGGGIAIIKAEEDSRIKTIISLAGVSDYGKRFANLGDLKTWKNTGVTYVINGRTKQHMPHYYQFYTTYLQHENRLNIKRAAKHLNKPFLIIHGDNDTSVLIEEAHNLHLWNPQSELKIIKNANHVFEASHPWIQSNMPKQLTEVVEIVVAFIRKT
ncbi:alpha/beta hydrolase family protein [Formosa sp. A9]|uniref:alpha/beta hydrolase family protein n=1 Tax=Formosa sp. A9 TaxID=3442641 RepID=UPI003EB7CA13